METKIQQKLPDDCARLLAEINAADMHALSDAALRAKADEFRKRLLEAKVQKIA